MAIAARERVNNVKAAIADTTHQIHRMYPAIEGILTGGATAISSFTPWGLAAHTLEKYKDIWVDIFRDKKVRQETERPLLLRRTVRHAVEIVVPVGLVVAGHPILAGVSIAALRIKRGIEEQKIREGKKSGIRRGIL